MSQVVQLTSLVLFPGSLSFSSLNSFNLGTPTRSQWSKSVTMESLQVTTHPPVAILKVPQAWKTGIEERHHIGPDHAVQTEEAVWCSERTVNKSSWGKEQSLRSRYMPGNLVWQQEES